MKVDKVRISNFRSIIDSGEVIIDEKITILLGKNEQGKTNFLKALESFKKDYEEDDLCYLSDSRDYDPSEIPLITVYFKLDHHDQKLLKRFSSKFSDTTEIVITKYFDNHYEIEKPKIDKILEDSQEDIRKVNDSINKHLVEIENKLALSNKTDKQKHINWLISLQMPDGGFSHIPGQSSHITYTYFAVKALIELGALDRINKQKLIEFILSIQHPDGGFGHLPSQPPQAQFTCDAILLLKELKALNKTDKQKHINWLISLQMPDGGFSHIPGQSSHITYTYFAVKALIELGALDRINKQKLIEFILSIQHPDGGFGHLPSQPPQAQFTCDAILLVKELEIDLIHNFKEATQTLSKLPLDTDEIRSRIETLFDIFKNLKEQEFSSIVEDIEKIKKKMKINSKSNILKEVLNLISNFVYFDSIDIIEDKISMNEYLENKEKNGTFSNLFQLAGLNIENIKKIKDHHRRKRAFRNASATITGLINNSWTQEKVRVNIDIDGDQILVFIEDDAGAKADPPSKRSDGFRWFLSFYINFMAGTKGELKNAILLLDNPGWILHPSGQKDFLNTLEKMAENNQIVLATHSPFLIDKNKLERIRIVERRADGAGTKIYEKFYDSIYDSLQVIRAAIGADISDSLFGHKNNIVVEGYSDKLYLEAMANYLKKKKREVITLSNVMINGAGGADKIVYLLSWHKAEGYNVIGILDNDNKGNKAITEIKNKNLEIDVEKDVLKLDEIDDEFKGKGIEIEDLFDDEFFNKAVSIAYKEIFERKLEKTDINIDELPQEGLRTKKYERFFRENKLGGFDKIKIAMEIKKMLEKERITEGELGNSIDNFEKLFKKINEKFGSRGLKL